MFGWRYIKVSPTTFVMQFVALGGAAFSAIFLVRLKETITGK